MVPEYSIELENLKRIPPKSSNVFHIVSTLISSHPRVWLFIVFLSVQTLLISFFRTPSPCLAEHATAGERFPPQIPAVSSASLPERSSVHDREQCPSGGIYVYELPSIFNKDLLLQNCTKLDQWNWQCGVGTNHGYGGTADELRRFLPESLFKSWFHTNQFSTELIFHHRILEHKCRTLDPESATAFYIPFYAGLAVGKFLWTNDTSKRDLLCKMMLNEVMKQRYWDKSNGSDHFMAIGRITWDFRRLSEPGKSWGSSFLNMPEMKKVTRFIIEKAEYDEHDVGVPYPTGFHPKTTQSLNEWLNFAHDYNRSTLFTFIGATRDWVSNDFRGLLLNYCKRESDSCHLVDCATAPCSTDSWVVLQALLGSHFCLQPRGDSFTRRSVFDCMVAGSIPVFFWKKTAYEQYDWFLPGDPESYSVFIDHEQVRNGASIKEALMKYDNEEIRKKRLKVIETIPRIIYSQASGGSRNFSDAFDVAVNGILQRIKEEKEWSDLL